MASPTQQLIRYALSLLLFYGGAVWILRRLRAWTGRGRIHMLAYHGVGEGPFLLNLFLSTKKFEAQMAFLKKHYEVLPLRAAVDLLREGRRPPEDVVVVTLDDDYKEGYTNVFPVAKKFGLPMTFYVTSDHITRGRPSFVYAVILAVHHTKATSLDVMDYGLGHFDFTKPGHKERAVATLDAYEKEHAHKSRDVLLRSVAQRLGFMLEDPLFQNRVLTWDEVREMQKHDITFGAHTVTHPMLRGMPLSEAEWEIRESKAEIERRTGQKVTSFAYPYGTRREVDEAAIDIARRSGFASAVTLEGRKDDQKDMYKLDRLMVGDELTSGWRGRYSQAMFACSVAGIFGLVKKPWDQF